MSRRFSQVDVFSAAAFRGNPLAVVHDADGLDDATMAVFARWTNLSETTFLLPPTDAAADYRVRIFTPAGELPFAGHPTLGSCHAWLEAGGTPRGGAGGRDEAVEIVQECGLGLVRVRRDADGLAFVAPELLRSGPVEEAEIPRLAGALGLERDAVVDAAHVDNGPGWVGLRLADARAVLDLAPDLSRLDGAKVGVIGPYGDDPDRPADYEVRAFFAEPGGSGFEDPVTGSLNAGLGQWLVGAGVAPRRYVASQGTVLRRRGRIVVTAEGDDVRVGGRVRTLVHGTVDV